MSQLCGQATQTLQHIEAGSVKRYGVTTRERIRSLPDTPTLEEPGLKGFELKVWHGICAPEGTPKQAIDKFDTGLRSWLEPEIDIWGVLIRTAGRYADGGRHRRCFTPARTVTR